jgi:hypothetical protein
VVSHCISHILVDRDQNLFVAPVKVLLGISTHHGIDHSGHAGLTSSANVIKIHHALNKQQYYDKNEGCRIH